MSKHILSILSFYLDYIIVGTAVALATFFLGEARSALAGGDAGWYVEFGTSIALVLLRRALGLSVGDALLAPACEIAHERPGSRLWPNLLLGTLLVLDGLKQMVRWSQLDAVLPAFGLVETTPAKAALLIAMGALYVAAGSMVLRLARNAKAAAITALAVSAASLGLSWSVLPQAIARAQAARRAAQGLTIREGELETMQAMMPWIWAAGIVLFSVLVWMVREREG